MMTKVADEIAALNKARRAAVLAAHDGLKTATGTKHARLLELLADTNRNRQWVHEVGEVLNPRPLDAELH